ncbi:MAG: hypothetical protein ABEJ56_03510 [Candidatus Nanohaloarchaea archaeon]
MDEVVPDTNTLIYLAKSGMLPILDRYEVYITREVFDEAVKSGKKEDKSDAFLLERHIEENWNNEKVDKEKLEEELDYFGARGETSVYMLADKKDIPALTSDKVARNKMRKKQVDVIRTDMLLLKQFRNNQLEKSELREKLNRLNSVNGTTGQRINFLMKKAEEHARGEEE